MNIISIDVHRDECELANVNNNGKEVDHVVLNTSLNNLIHYVKKVKNKINTKLHVVFEEGELAGWLYRGLKSYVDKVVSADPVKNELIYNYKSKKDKIDPLDLARLYRSGHVNPIHHTESEERAKLKDLVYTYHKITKDVTRSKNRLKSFYRKNGIMVKGSSIYNPKNKEEYLSKLKSKENAEVYFDILHYLQNKKEELKKRIRREVKKYSPIIRMKTVPGVGNISGVTLFVIIDTPYRFSDKSKLWSYANIGRRIHQSGKKQKNKKQKTGNRLLKKTVGHIFQAAMTEEDNKFIRKFMDLLTNQNKKRNLAKRIVYRKILTTVWSIWKNGTKYRDDY